MLIMLTAVLWDFGGVILTSPFEAFRRFEIEHGLPVDHIRTVNTTNPHTNAWALLERNDITPAEFDELFAAESEALGHRVAGADVLSLLAGDVRPEMVATLDRVRAAGYRTACLTNNVIGGDGRDVADDERSVQIKAIMDRFDVIVESSKVGVRKPEPRFYEIACELLQVRTGRVCVPRRSRHQLEARGRDGNDDDQGHGRGASNRRPQCGARLGLTVGWWRIAN